MDRRPDRSSAAIARVAVLLACDVEVPLQGVTRLAEGRTSSAWRCAIGSQAWVVRIPVADSGRRLTYQAEACIGHELAARGHPVVAWDTVRVDDLHVSVGPLIAGTPLATNHRAWTVDFTRQLARLLADLHGLDCAGWGPLRDHDAHLAGISRTATAGIIDRWHHAPIWPFDQTDLRSHPLATAAPELVDAVTAHEGAIRDAAVGRRGLVHSDLHGEHLLRAADGALAGVLDFGDAFIGSRAWDFALLVHYYGADVATNVAEASGAADLMPEAHELAIAVAVYKIAKSNARRTDIDRLRSRLNTPPNRRH